MSDGEGRAVKRAPAWWDWPIPVMVLGLVLVFVPGANYFGAVLFWGGLIALLIRRGAFNRRRDGVLPAGEKPKDVP
jgi:hypothetical protein